VVHTVITHSRYRANLDFQGGTYVNDNYVNEPVQLKKLFNANIGVAFDKKGKWWLDAGIFGNSHIGAEDVRSIYDWTFQRSILTENLPYFISGGILSFEPNKNWEFKILLLNGWQRIKPVEGNSLLSIGGRAAYTINKDSYISYANFYGTDDPDSTRRMRFFNDLHTRFKINEHWGFLAQSVFGIQQQSKGSNVYNTWYGFYALAKYFINDKFSTGIGWDYYSDPDQVIVTGLNNSDYVTSGLLLNFDYWVFKRVLCRLEGRWFSSINDIYPRGETFVKDNVFVIISMSISFEKIIYE